MSCSVVDESRDGLSRQWDIHRRNAFNCGSQCSKIPQGHDQEALISRHSSRMTLTSGYRGRSFRDRCANSSGSCSRAIQVEMFTQRFNFLFTCLFEILCVNHSFRKCFINVEMDIVDITGSSPALLDHVQQYFVKSNTSSLCDGHVIRKQCCILHLLLSVIPWIVVYLIHFLQSLNLIIIIIIIIMNFYSPVSNTRCHSIGHKMRIARIKIRVDGQGRWEIA